MMSNGLTTLGNLEVTSFEQLFELTDRLSKATGFLPKIFEGKPGAVLACVLKGRELGFETMASFSALFVMNFKGDFRIGIYADAQLALLVRRGYKYEWVEMTDEKATIKLMYEGRKDFELSYTIGEAKTARLSDKDIWKAYPAQMLRARATSAAARAYAPEVMHGVYSKEELDDLQEDERLEKVISFNDNKKTGNEILLAALDARIEKPQEVAVVSDSKDEALEESEPDSFIMLEDMLDNVNSLESLDCVAVKIKESNVTDDERDILRSKYTEKKGNIGG